MFSITIFYFIKQMQIFSRKKAIYTSDSTKYRKNKYL